MYHNVVQRLKVRWGVNTTTYGNMSIEGVRLRHGDWFDVDTVFGTTFTLSLRFITNVDRMAASFHDLRALHNGHNRHVVPLPVAARPPPAAGGEPAFPDVTFFSAGLWPLARWVEREPGFEAEVLREEECYRFWNLPHARRRK
jgi:hypothetical protein